MNRKSYLLAGSAIVLGGVVAASAASAATYTYGANAAGNTVVIAQATSQASTQTTNLIGSRVSSAVSSAVSGSLGGASAGPTGGGFTPGVQQQGTLVSSDAGQGRASGSAPRRTGVWLNGGYTWLENKQAGANFDGGITNVMGGIDYLVQNNVLVGVSAGYEHQDITTKFNSGTLKGDGLTIAPYFAFILNKNINFDASIGHSWVNYDMTRSGGAVTGSTDGDRWFGIANANYTTSINNWQLGASLGYLYSMEKQDAYHESNGNAIDEASTHLGQARLGGKVGYVAATNFGYLNPYTSARLEYDVVKDHAGTIDAQGTLANSDDFGVTFGLGMNAGIGENTTLNLEGTTTQFREDQSVYGVSGTVRYKF